MNSFKEQYLSGKVDISKLDDFVDDWHKDKTKKMTLQDYLGFNDDEYAAFAHSETEIKNLLDSQKNKVASVLKVLAKIVK